MILPTKHVSTSHSILGLGATILLYLDKPRTVSSLWGRARKHPEIGTFDRFTLVLDFLYMIGAVDFENNLLRRNNSDR
jgi:hypothetical protein